MKPLCVLDFFVDPTVQRGGHGKHLFDIMLSHQSVVPQRLAYDRPSPKLMGFLAKYFNLTKYVQQNNNYVVFDDYYSTEPGSNEKQPVHGRTQASGWNNEA
jgi:alpha-tubulin N-acetyltransferase 1